MKRLVRYEEVLLPTGLRIRGVRPTAQELVRRGLWPHDLRTQLFLGGSVTTPDDDAETQKRYVESQHITIAAYIRYEQDPDTSQWERVEYTPAEVHDFDPMDVDALEDLVLRRRTPAQVSAQTRALRGEIDADELSAILEKEAAATVPGWAEFRRDDDSVTAGSDSGDVEADPVGVPAGGGRRAGARTRRGARGAAAAG